ncbi:MAG: 50S ribosomal protein L15 [Desulfomonilia bacterium]|nr:50S ribosomal protein L15 [Deltaproteobacteria bacterium]MDX9762454.1 50S ribosomal protein L15 [Desulfomonilia bacterium]HPW70009.1 50S ribosomal protein L15 [Deltaproteobacteria bacterium]
MNLSNLKPAPGSRKKTKRLGRGDATGQGGTSGRGHKGQKARSGGKVPAYFEGGQMPIYRRLPKRGFKNPFRKEYAVINIQDLVGFEPGSVVDIAALKERGMIRSTDTAVKLLAEGELTVALTVKLDKASQAALEKIRSAGGTFETLL